MSDTAAATQRLERLLAMSKRLAEAIAADLAALEAGDFAAIRTADPEVERLAALYGHEINALKTQGGWKDAPAALVSSLKKAGAHLKTLLDRHQRLVGVMRKASEGLIKAVAEEVEKSRARAIPYQPRPQAQRRPASAIIYNKTI